MEIYEIENRKISNKLYNLGLERAKLRDLFGATIYLKKALRFNKKNANARNLMGLIFYEEGAVVEAVREWVISRDINNLEVNPAKDYLYRVKNDENSIKQYESVKLYNESLFDLKGERYDLAMIKLYKAVEQNDHNVKAMQLLALLQLKLEDHIKAGAYLLKCQKIDNGNKWTNDFMDYVLKHTKKSEIKEKKLGNIYSIKKLESDDAIIPRKYIKLSENQKVIFVLIGIAIGALSYSLIILPFNKNGNSIESDKEVIKYANLVNDQNKIIRDITIENNQLKTDYDEASVKLKAYEK